MTLQDTLARLDALERRRSELDAEITTLAANARIIQEALRREAPALLAGMDSIRRMTRVEDIHRLADSLLSLFAPE